MTRLVKNWTAELVADATVAPHRYLWSGTILADGSLAKDLDDCETAAERKSNLPYAVGEVVYVDVGDADPVKARVHIAFWSMNSHGERREFYNVQQETKSGVWSKLWTRVWSGHIQRGYQKAGLAPDVPA